MKKSINKLPKKVSKFIQATYYKDKPLVKLNRPLGLDTRTFEVASIEKEVNAFKEASELFDKVIYPIKIIIPKDKRKKLGVREMVFKTYKGKPNFIRYYTKNKTLNDKQCSLLYLHKDPRETYGFTVNDKAGFGSKENLANYIRVREGIEQRALAQVIRDERDKAVRQSKEEEGKRAIKDLAELSLRLQKNENKLQDQLKELKEPMENIRSALNPFGFGLPQVQKDGLLGKTILGGTIARPTIPKVKPDGHKRMPITGTGLTSYMLHHKLDNPVDIAKKFLTKEGKKFKDNFSGKGREYKAKGFDHLRMICEQMNVDVEEAFLYICEGMNDSKLRWRTHRLDREFWRGSQSVVNLVKYFNEKVDISKKDRNALSFTVKMLHNSDYCTNIFNEYGVVKPDYTKFTKWFKEMRHHVTVLKLDKK